MTQKLFSFQGRIGRGTFWTHSLVNVLVFILLNLPGAALGSIFGAQSMCGKVLAIAVLPGSGFAFLWVALALQIKRWQDRGKSGVMILVEMISVAGQIWAFVECGLLPGTPGQNQYSAPPATSGNL